jgi:hypothetical protein
MKDEKFVNKIKQLSIKKYTKPKEEVENQIIKLIGNEQLIVNNLNENKKDTKSKKYETIENKD